MKLSRGGRRERKNFLDEGKKFLTNRRRDGRIKTLQLQGRNLEN